jgi:hypothetical protein
LTNASGSALAAAAGQRAGGGGASSGGQASGTGGGGQQGTGGGTGEGGTGGQQATGGNQQASGQQTGGQQTGGGGQGGQGTTQSAGGQASGAGSGQGTSTGATAGASSSGSLQSGGTSSGATSASAESTEQAATTTVVGFYGTNTELRFDISRLPRVDQYEVLQSADDSGENEFPSDIKTIAYFLQSDESGEAITSPGLGADIAFAEPSTSGRGRGLMRAEQDRAVLTLAEDSGLDTAIYSKAKLLAEEVVGLTFQYYDGTEWLTEWDSSTTGSLPRAVEIVLTIQPTYAMNERDLSQSSATSTAPETNFRLVVRLPSAPLVAPTTTEESTTDTSGTTSSATSQSGSSSGSPSQGTMP